MPSVSAPQGNPLDVARTFQQALELHHQGRIAEAEPHYAVVLAVRPDHFDALQMLGVIKLGRGDLGTALRLIGAALQQRPTSPQVLLNHGNVLDAMKRHHEALTSFDEAIKRKSRYAEAHNNRGSALISLERYDESLESFRRAIAIKPDYAEAVTEFDRALAILPNFPEAMLNRCGSLRALKRFDEMLKSLDALLAAHPDYAEAHNMRGMLLAD